MDVLGAVREAWNPRVPSAGPAIVALAMVVAIALAMFGSSIYWMHRTGDEGASLVHNSLRSVELVDDLRYKVARLEAEGDGPKRDKLKRHVVGALGRYTPLATQPEETAELARLTRLLGRVFALDAADPERRVRFEQVQGSLERLVEINARTANRTIEGIRRSSHAAVLGQVLAAILSLFAASVVGWLLYRVLARQRARVEHELVTLEERNSDLNAFVGRTAHDLRAPLTPIRGYADLLVAGSGDVTKAAERIRTSAARMADMLDDLTMLSTSGTLPAGESDVAPVIREVLVELATDLEGAKTSLVIEECRVACAPGVLCQILQNIVTNACKYRSPERTLVIQIETRCEGDTVAIAITDNGIGMTPETLAHAFEARYRAQSVGDVRGAGLGLSIVKRMVDVAGGSCTLTSELGRGTRFHMRLPASRPVFASNSAPAALIDSDEPTR